MSTKGKKTGRKRRQKKLWKSLFDVRNDFTYNKMIGILEQKGIDYRIWMDADDEDLIYLRETFGGPERFQVYYKIYVKGRDYYRAGSALNLDLCGGGGHMSLYAIFF